MAGRRYADGAEKNKYKNNQREISEIKFIEMLYQPRLI